MLETKNVLAANRRDFLKSMGGGLLVLFSLEDVDAQESGRSGRHAGGQALPENVAAWLHIAPDGTMTVFTGKVEVGQNIRTSLTQAVADELRCPAGSVQLVMGDTSQTPWDMGTFGSRTTPTMAPVLRKMAATARETLLDTAAKNWSVDRNSLTVSNGCITNRASGKSAKFGELAATVDWVHTIGKSDCVTPADKWQVAGTSLTKVNAREMVTGKHKFASDHKLRGMLYGRVLRQPSFGAKLLNADTSSAAQIPGVTVVRDGDFICVVAPNEHIAQKALDSVKANWEEQLEHVSARDLFGYIKANAGNGSADAHVESAYKTLSTSYTVAYIAHVPLEPRAAVADWTAGKLTVWTGTQRPFGVRTQLAETFGMPENQVRVLMPDTGAAYGGKHTGECAIEAARLAKGAGKPVKLIWTREEEFTWAYFRPAGVIDVKSSVAKDGALLSWDFRNYLSGPSGLETPYEVANPNVEYREVKSPLREGSYRGLAATANHFARESHMDELATAVGMDPLAFRLKNLQNPRIRAVLEAAAERFQWSKNTPSKNRGYGLACGTEKGGYIACCAEVSIGQNRHVRIERVVEAWECGAVVNPEHLKNQVEGAIVMGIGGALFEAIDFADGKILNARLSKYRVPRFSDVPRIDLVLLDRKDLPSAGAGETPIVGIAPAVANAICNATGARVRSMPMLPEFQAS